MPSSRHARAVSGEGKVAAAISLFDRVLEQYPRALDVVLGDGLYAQSEFFNQVRSNGKDVLAVLKEVQRDLLKGARSLFDDTPPSGICTDRGRPGMRGP